MQRDLREMSRRALNVIRRRGRPTGPSEFETHLGVHERDVLDRCRPYTMASPERVVASMDAVAHAVDHGVQGAIVECGVWRGGSTLAMVLTLMRLGAADRDVYLYDTFEGMTEPTDADTSTLDGSALASWRSATSRGHRPWKQFFEPEIFALDQVKQVLTETGYPQDRLHFVVGPVEQTIPATVPDSIAVLRLDTDWYESTQHEMHHLYPRLCPGGVLLVDDYGHWDGARQAVDEFFAQHGPRPLLARTDYTGRMAVKPA